MPQEQAPVNEEHVPWPEHETVAHGLAVVLDDQQLALLVREHCTVAELPVPVAGMVVCGPWLVQYVPAPHE